MFDDRFRLRVHAIARCAVAFVWLWHGLVPKLLFRDADEYAQMRAGGIPELNLFPALTFAGLAEIILGIALLTFWSARWPLVLTIALMAIALVGIGLTSPSHLTAAFNPVTLNICVAALAAIDFLACTKPSAGPQARASSGEPSGVQPPD